MATVTIGRWGLRVPDGSELPNVPLWLNRLATDLSDVAKDNQGTLAARPVSTALSPGIAGRWYTTTDEAGGRRTYRDHGTGWEEIPLVPIATADLADRAVTALKIENQQAWQTIALSTPLSGTLSYYKDSLGIVHIRSQIWPGTGTSGSYSGGGVGQLPAGYLPVAQLPFYLAFGELGGLAGQTQYLFTIETSGIITVRNTSSMGAGINVAPLAPIHFRAEG